MASAYSALLLVFFFWIYEPVSPIELGSSLSTNFPPTSWPSPSRLFAFGFYRQGSGFIVGIWLASKPDATFTWTINRDVPHVSSNATLELTKKGKLLLRRHRNNATDEEIFIANFTGSASCAQMLDSGNFVLYNERSKAIWESFSFPTDTILGGQNLYKGGELFSRASAIDLSTGRFHLKMQDDGNLVLYPVDTLDLPLDAYWSSGTDGKPGIHLILTGTGDLLLVNQTLHTIETVASSGSESNSTSIIYRATLEYDGIFRFYSHNFDGVAKYIISLMWYVPRKQCEVRGFCGFNSYCTMNDDQPDCLCLPGTAYVDPNQRFHGCERDYNEGSCKHTNEMSSLYNITVMDQIAWDDNAYFQASMSEEGCRKSCLEDCNCASALYELGNCKKQKYPVKYAIARERQDQSSKSFFKVALESIKSSNHSSAIGMVPSVIQRTSKKAVVLILVMSLAFITWRNMEINVSKPEEVLLSKWAYELLVARELDRLDLGEDVDRQKLEKMVMIGIWCIQDEPGLRPSMKTVVMMLEGITDVSVPPRPTSASA
ncbi:hypothetical protein Peur_029036 [Populus x canadensis]